MVADIDSSGKVGADQIFHQCLALDTLAEFQDSFRSFISASNSNKWMISSDYCLHAESRSNDVFAFTVYPHNKTLESIQDEVKRALPTDIKNVRLVSKEGINLLRDSERYHFCFLVNPDRKFVKNLNEARQFLDDSIKTARNWGNAAHAQEFIEALEALRREANSNSFKTKLLEDIVLACVFVGFIASMIAKYDEPEIIGWFSDRDSITTAWNKVAGFISAINYSAFCQQNGLGEKVHDAKFVVAAPDTSSGKEQMWFDELVRLPDYLAGALAAYDIQKNLFTSNQLKHADVINRAIAGNSHIQVMKLTINPESIKIAKVTILKRKEGFTMKLSPNVISTLIVLAILVLGYLRILYLPPLTDRGTEILVFILLGIIAGLFWYFVIRKPK